MNATLAATLRTRRAGQVAMIEPPDAGEDPYLKRGSHPDVVERIWDGLGRALPVDCRAILFGSPALVEPSRGVALAQAFGNSYIIRVPMAALEDAIAAGCAVTRAWGIGGHTDLEAEYGRGWVFGAWVKQEADWLRGVYEVATEGAAGR